MKNILILISFLLVFMVNGCSSDSQSTTSNTAIDQAIAAFGCESGEYPLTGCWLTQQCEEAIFDGQSLNRWVYNIFSFNADHTTQSAEIQYDNANCMGTPKLSPISPFPDPLTYEEFGSVQTTTGLTAYQITLTTSNPAASYQALYHITGNKLCFSANIRIESLYRSFTPLDPSNQSIDLDNCLLKAKS